MAKTDIYEVTIIEEFIDGDVFPLPKDFREREGFYTNEFYGFDRENSTTPPEDGYEMNSQHIGSFTTMDKAIHALKEYGINMTILDDGSAVSETPHFDIDEDSDDRSITNFVIEKVKLNTFNENFEDWIYTLGASNVDIDELHDSFLNAVADMCEKYGVERKDMKDFITMHVNDDFEGGN
jgi:hypothetical protein